MTIAYHGSTDFNALLRAVIIAVETSEVKKQRHSTNWGQPSDVGDHTITLGYS